MGTVTDSDTPTVLCVSALGYEGLLVSSGLPLDRRATVSLVWALERTSSQTLERTQNLDRGGYVHELHREDGQVSHTLAIQYTEDGQTPKTQTRSPCLPSPRCLPRCLSLDLDPHIRQHRHRQTDTKVLKDYSAFVYKKKILWVVFICHIKSTSNAVQRFSCVMSEY